MNWIDAIIGIFLLIALINGYRKGLVMKLVELATIILAAVFGGPVARIIQPKLSELVDASPGALHVLSYLAAFGAIAIVVFLIGLAINNFLKIVQLSFINRLMGSIISVLTTVLALSILLNLVSILDPKDHFIKKKTKESSFFYHPMKSFVSTIVPYLSETGWDEYIPEKYRERMEQQADSSLHPSASAPSAIDSIYQERYFNVN